jgi:hypothetical protein
VICNPVTERNVSEETCITERGESSRNIYGVGIKGTYDRLSMRHA